MIGIVIVLFSESVKDMYDNSHTNEFHTILALIAGGPIVFI